jgi:Transglutaminase-like superfamily
VNGGTGGPALAAPRALAGALGRFVLVPAEHASYDTDPANAARSLRLEADEIAALADAGLPHVADTRRGPLFDYVDLINVAAFSGSGQSVPELALRFLLRFSASPAPTWYEPRDWLIGIRLPQEQDAGPGQAPGGPQGQAPGGPQGQAPGGPQGQAPGGPQGQAPGGPQGQAPGGPPGRPQIRVRVPDLSADGVDAVPEAAAAGLAPPQGTDPLARGYQAVVRLTGTPHTVADRRVRAIWTEVVAALTAGRVVYQAVPESLRAMPWEAWQLGMADCIVVSRLLASRIRAAGLPARARRGYLLGLVGSDHAWCEIYEAGRWRQLDAVFAFAAAGGGRDRNLTVDAPAFAEACFGSRFNRLLPCVADDAAPLVYFGERPAPPWALAGVSARLWRPA